MELPEKFYACGGILLALPLMAMLCPARGLLLIDLAAMPTLLCFVAGYLTWWTPKFMRVWQSNIGRVPLVLLNGTLLPLCGALGRIVASKATGLPAQALDLTVGLLAILSYPVVWGIFFFLFIAVGAFVSIVVAMTLSTSVHFFRTMISLVLPWRRQTGGPGWIDRLANHGFGGLVAAMLVAGAVAAYSNGLYSERLIRLLAYRLDFGYAEKYPLVDHTRPMRLLDNQYAAYAEFKDWDVEFAVVKLVEEPAANKH
ncbi:hypothetical protein [Ralstonia mojiangensis]|uniref:hypothetical protein n=1 Tax=Ralstonia mojiangensis TaxID=2953895 RepID=UPI00209167C6|nr:hypothetical protein [Ralstonia mojiangensis]MCO5411096.1 hypothetical protein [Ralstonia mojiangensis]